jgi:hypothetical protein
MSSKGNRLAVNDTRAEALERAKRNIEQTGEAGDSLKACTGRCNFALDAVHECEFCERHILQLDGSWVVQTLE